MPDIASLGLQIDTSQLVDGKKALDQFADAGAKVEQGARSLNGQMNDTAKLMRAQAEATRAAEDSKHKLIIALEREIAVAGMSRGELERYKAAEAGLGRAAQDRAMALGNTVDAMRREEAEMRALAASQDRATASAEAFIKRIQQQAATLGMGRSQLLAYQAAQLGVSKEAEAAVAKIKAYEDAIKAAADAKAAAEKQSNMLSGAVKMLVAAYGALKLGEYIKDAALLAARYETLGVVTTVVGRNAGYTKTQMDTATAAIAAQGITMIESRESATKLVQAHVDLSYATQLARIAQDAAVIGHINSSEAFDRLVNGIARGNVLILRNIGINVNMENAYRQMGQTLGKNANDLTENERVQARLNAVLERGTDIAGTYEAAMDTAGKQLTSMQRYTQDLKTVIGETFNETLTIAVMALTDGLKDANKEVTELSKNEQLHEWGKSLADVFVWVGNTISNVTTVIQKTRAAEAYAWNVKSINSKYDDIALSPEVQGDFMDFSGRSDRVARVFADRKAALAELSAAYDAQQAKLSDQFDRFDKSAVARQAALTARHKAEADARLKVDQEYAEKATALLIANADKSVEVQQAAQMKLMKSIYVGTPTYKDTDPKPAKAKVDRVANTELDDSLARIQDRVNAQKSMYDNLGKLDDAYHAAGKLGDEEFYQNQRARLSVAGDDQFKAYSDQIAALKAYHNGTAAEAAKHAKQINDIDAKRQAAYNDNKAAIDLIDKKEALRKDAVASASEDAKNKYLSGLDEEARKLEEANSAHETSKGAVERETIARLDLAIATQKQFIADQATSGATAEEIAQAPVILKYLEDVRAARARIAAGLDQQQQLQYKDKAADQAIKDWQRAGQTISDGLTDAFGRAGKAAGQMYQAYAKGMSEQLRAQKDLAAAKKMSDDNPEKIEAINRAQLNGALARTKSYADMATAAQGFFDEGSKGYKAMHAASVALHTAEVALSLIKGVNAVLTQGEGDPYTAFGRMAAMAAIVAALGVAIGGGGGSSNIGKDRQAAAGTGTVLGDSSAKSDSIKRSLELVANNSTIELDYTRGMLTSLRSIESSLSGLGNLLIRTSGISGDLPSAVNGSTSDMVERLFGHKLLGSAAGNFAANVSNAIFGGRVTALDGGVTIDAVALGQALANGVNASKYVDIKKSGGLFHSDKYSTQYTDLGDAADRQFSAVISNIAATVSSAADLLGLGGDEFTAHLNQFVVDIGKVSLKDLDGEEIQAALNTVFSKLGDDMAQFGVGGLEQFQQVGEGYFETLTRVATNYANLDSILAASGTTFGQTGLASIAARERLIALTGGIDKLASQQSSFNENFLSKAEQLAPVQKYVTDQLAAMGLQSLDTRDKFKEYTLGLASSGQLATEAGAQQYAALLALSEAFAKTHAATVDLTKSEQEIADERASLQDRLDELTMTQAQLAEKARNAIAAQNLVLYDQVIAAQAAKDAIAKLNDLATALSNAVSDAYSNLQAVIARERDAANAAYQTASDALQASLDKVSTSVSNLQNLSNSLHSTLDGMQVPGQEKVERQAAQAQIEAALAIAKAGGPLPDADSLKNALSVVGKDASGQFGSYLDYQRDLYTTKNTLASLTGYTDEQLSTEQLTLKAIKDQKTALDEAHKKELAKFDAILDQAKSQIDALNGIRNGIGSIPEALNALANSLKAAYSNPVASAGSVAADAYKQYLGRDATSSELEYWKAEAAKGVNVVSVIANSDEAKIQDLYRTLLGHFGDAASVDAWEAALATGQTWDQIRAGLMDTEEYKKLHVPGFAGGGDHLGGLRIVGENGPELEATGPSRIFNASQTRTMLNGGDNSELITELRELRRAVNRLEGASNETASNTSLFKRVIRNDRLYASTKEEEVTA